MKKLTSILLMLCLCISLCACVESAETQIPKPGEESPVKQMMDKLQQEKQKKAEENNVEKTDEQNGTGQKIGAPDDMDAGKNADMQEGEDAYKSDAGLKENQPAQNTVYVTKTGDKYHTSACQYLSRSKIAISIEEAKESGYTPCSKCNPPE